MKTKMHEYLNSQKMKFTNPDTEYYIRSVRFLLLMINAMCIINGCLMIVVGTTLCSHHYSFSFFYAKRTNLFLSPFVTHILLGLLLLAVTVFGLFAILKQSTYMLILYVLMLTNILFLKLGGAITAFTDDNSNVMKLKDIPVLDYASVPEFQAKMDTLQVALHCCGNDSFLDYAGMEFTRNHSTLVVSKEVHGELMTVTVPGSCCATPGDVMCNWPKTEGCKNALINDIVQNYRMIAELKIPVIFVELLAVVFALLFQRGIRKLEIANANLPRKSSFSQSPDNK